MKKTTIKKIFFYLSRITNALILGFVLFFVLAHIFGDAEQHGEGFRDISEVIMFIHFPILTCVGLALAWKWELLGGVISFLSIAVIMILQGHLLDEIQFWIISLPGLLHVIHAKIDQSIKASN